MILKGKGMACFYYGMGNTGKPNPSSAFVELMQDGSVNVLCGAADIGQGSNTLFCQIVAQELGISFENINIVSADTGVTPEAGVTSACRQTYISGNAVLSAVRDAKNKLFAEAAEMLNVNAARLYASKDHIFVADSGEKVSIAAVVNQCWYKGKVIMGVGDFNPSIVPLDDLGRGVPYATYSYGAMIAEVEVDTETGAVNVIKLTAAQDVGKAINPLNIEGQIEGGISMGIGFFSSEEVVLDKGAIVNPNFQEYLIPTALDMPDIETIIVEVPEPTGPFGAKGMGEPSNVPVASSIINAVANATGKRIKELPCTAEKVFWHCRKSADV
jgi:CO/xanthine dehydrogenase Mo-binding subunit